MWGSPGAVVANGAGVWGTELLAVAKADGVVEHAEEGGVNWQSKPETAESSLRELKISISNFSCWPIISPWEARAPARYIVVLSHNDL